MNAHPKTEEYNKKEQQNLCHDEEISMA